MTYYKEGLMDRMQKLVITTNAIAGLPQTEIAEKVGVSNATVCRYLQKEKIKNIIEAAQSKIAARALKPALDNVVGLIQDYSKPIVDPESKYELQRKDHGFKASKMVLESAGLIGATPSHTVNQVFVQNNQQYISPVVDRALEMAMKTPQDVVIDAELDEENES